MREYSFTEARKNFTTLLNDAKKDGVVCIKQRDGEVFYIKPAISKKSPLDIDGVNLGISLSEIVEVVREGRER